MDDFPRFVKNPANRIATASQHTPGVEGYVFDGADGSLVALWRAGSDAVTAAHTDDFDEYFVVVGGTYFLVVGGEEVRVDAGQEYFIKFAPWAETLSFRTGGRPAALLLETASEDSTALRHGTPWNRSEGVLVIGLFFSQTKVCFYCAESQGVQVSALPKR